MGSHRKRQKRNAGNKADSGSSQADPRGGGNNAVDPRDRITVKDNEKFKSYYKNQGILLEQEFEEFYSALQNPLPSTFRITGTRSHAMSIRHIVENEYVPAMQDISIDGVRIEPPKPIPWYPDRLAWQVHAPRQVIKRSPEFAKFHKFIVTETEVGNLSRQEAVSMVPPMLMDIQPHQWVLDMCAAPGSKTAQCIEAVHANVRFNETPAGLVVANDADFKRSYMLVHQSKRLQSPCFVATNHDGQHFPGIRVHAEKQEKTLLPLRFDRVLCDVPCSGDGTLRKNERIWATWTQGNALALHSTQVQIFLRGARLTKIGGRIVYSTCSFNPIENEAVVAEVLRRTNGALELKDVSNELSELKRKPGLKTWKVMTKDGKYISSVDEIEDENQRKRFPKSAFPPENVQELPLERCIRIYPHLQDTGGFFVAVFEKVKPMTQAERMMQEGNGDQQEQLVVEKEPELAETPEDDGAETAGSSSNQDETTNVVVPSKRPASVSTASDSRASKEAPFELLSPDSPELAEISDFYGLDPRFPRDQFLIRSEGKEKSRTIYFVSKAVKELLASADIHRLNLVMTGVRLFVRQSSSAAEGTAKTPFRLTCEGVPLLDSMLSDKRRVRLVSFAELKTLLTEAYPNISQLEPPTVSKLESMDLGCCVFDFDPAATKGDCLSRHSSSMLLPMALPVWRGKVSLSVLLNKQDKRALCQRIFGLIPEDTPEHLKERSVANQTKYAEKATAAV
ncbi:hypothetical protein VTP01DRAFT_2855 [Rhizomucor pusillus]|uniref:uncharacterized protein n=1 Tax=Rhizomucor pusillus TaxID=4840 RepID=UPI0037421AA7